MCITGNVILLGRYSEKAPETSVTVEVEKHAARVGIWKYHVFKQFRPMQQCRLCFLQTCAQVCTDDAESVCGVIGQIDNVHCSCAGATVTGSTMTVEGCGSASLQGDVRFAEVMGLMGAQVQWQPYSITITGLCQHHPTSPPLPHPAPSPCVVCLQYHLVTCYHTVLPTNPKSSR